MEQIADRREIMKVLPVGRTELRRRREPSVQVNVAHRRHREVGVAPVHDRDVRMELSAGRTTRQAPGEPPRARSRLPVVPRRLARWRGDRMPRTSSAAGDSAARDGDGGLLFLDCHAVIHERPIVPSARRGSGVSQTSRRHRDVASCQPKGRSASLTTGARLTASPERDVAPVVHRAEVATGRHWRRHPACAGLLDEDSGDVRRGDGPANASSLNVGRDRRRVVERPDLSRAGRVGQDAATRSDDADPPVFGTNRCREFGDAFIDAEPSPRSAPCSRPSDAFELPRR